MGRAVDDIVFLVVFIIGLAWLLSVIPASRELMRRHQLKKIKRRKERRLELEKSNTEFAAELEREIKEIDQKLNQDKD